MKAALASVEAHDGDLVTISLHDEIDLANAPGLGDEIREALPNRVRGVVLDLSAVTFIDSAGIRMIFEIAHATDVRGQQMRLAVPENSPVSEVLLAVAIGRVVPVDPDPSTALGSLRAASA